MSAEAAGHLARGLHDLTGHFLTTGMPRLIAGAGLAGQLDGERRRVEWEVLVFLLYCASEAATRELGDAELQRAVLLEYYRGMAGSNSLHAFLRDVQRRVDEYESGIVAAGRGGAARAAARVLHANLLPGEPPEAARLELLGQLYERMREAYSRVLTPP